MSIQITDLAISNVESFEDPVDFLVVYKGSVSGQIPESHRAQNHLIMRFVDLNSDYLDSMLKEYMLKEDPEARLPEYNLIWDDQVDYLVHFEDGKVEFHVELHFDAE